MLSVRFTRSLLLFLFVALLSTVPRPARSEIVHGFLKALGGIGGEGPFYVIPLEAFDFSTQTVVHFDSTGADLCFFEPVNKAGIWYFRPLAAGLIRVYPTSLEALLLAPEGVYSPHSRKIELNGIYVILTGDGLYAKFRVHEWGNGFLAGCCSVTIEYYVQLDGSRNLDPLVPVEPTTWGRVKALYSE